MQPMNAVTRPRRRLSCAVFCVVALMAHVGAQALSAAAQPTGSLTGIVTDEAGTPVAATIHLSGGAGSPIDAVAAADGRFAFAGVPPGRAQLVVTATGFATETIPIEVRAGAQMMVPPIHLRLAFDATAVVVSPSPVEIAEQQINEQEQQRVLGVVPNFYVSFVPNAAPLNVA